jgi:hypothetical protein
MMPEVIEVEPVCEAAAPFSVTLHGTPLFPRDMIEQNKLKRACTTNTGGGS